MKNTTIQRNGFHLNIVVVMLLSALINQGCAPFSKLPVIQSPENIEGTYYNKSIPDSVLRERTLWSLIDYKREVKRDSLLVKFLKTEEGMLKAILMTRDSVFVEKTIKGKFKDDGCYYTRRQFYVIPLLPILWAFSNYQQRIYSLDGALGYEVTSNSGGAVIIMASGNKYNQSYKFKSFKE